MSSNIFSFLNTDDTESDSSNNSNIKVNKHKKKITNNTNTNTNNKKTNEISVKYDFGAFEDGIDVFQSNTINKKKYNNDSNFEKKNTVVNNMIVNKNNHTELNNDKQFINDKELTNDNDSNDGIFNTYQTKKMVKKNNKITKIKSVLDEILFKNISIDENLKDLEMNNYFKLYAHSNKDENWDYNNYFKMTKNGLRSWKDIATFLKTLNMNFENYTMYDFDIFAMKNNISPMWEDEQNKHGSIMSIKLSSREEAYSIFTFLFLNICNNSLLKYTPKTMNKTNGISFSTKVIENFNITSYIIKVWFRDNFCHDETEILNPHINERLELDNYSVKFKQIKPEF
jgi:hypothetical protein